MFFTSVRLASLAAVGGASLDLKNNMFLGVKNCRSSLADHEVGKTYVLRIVERSGTTEGSEDKTLCVGIYGPSEA